MEAPVDSNDRLHYPILVVDDDPFVLLLLSEALHAAGYPVVTAATAQIALEVAQRAHPELLLLDIRLPDRHGIDLAQALGAQGLHPKIVVMSGANARLAAEEIEADDYLDKPFGLSTLLHSVERMAA